jgi:hypothetical protein
VNALAITSVVIAFIAAVGGPLGAWLIWRKTKADAKAEKDAAAEAIEDQTAAGSWRDFNQSIVRDRNDLREQLAESQRQRTQDIRDLRAEYDVKLAQRDTRIKDLENQVESLYRRLVLKDANGAP